MLTLYRRHLKKCDHRSEGRSYRRCKCPIWVDGFLDGHELRKSLNMRDWQKASDQIHEWEARGRIEEKEPEHSLSLWHKRARDSFVMRERGNCAPLLSINTASYCGVFAISPKVEGSGISEK